MQIYSVRVILKQSGNEADHPEQEKGILSVFMVYALDNPQAKPSKCRPSILKQEGLSDQQLRLYLTKPHPD